MFSSTTLRAVLAAGMVIAAGCDMTGPEVPDEDPVTVGALAPATPPAPSPLVRVAGLEFWPFTAATLGPTPSDPINLTFPGVDVRSVRAALILLDGDRTALGFPASAPFDCTWKEAMGSNQVGYAVPGGWTGSAIQLECGDYGPVRFHIRMFPAENGIIANAHFELLIPGTNEHEVLSWELAEALVTADLVRAGVLAEPPAPSGPITPTPTYRTIDPLVYALLPAALKALVGGPEIPNDGRATILSFAGEVQGERTVARREFVLDFDQTIPKPFCMQGPLDYLQVVGPIHFSQHVVVAGSGNVISRFHARGGLNLTPVNPVTGETGEQLQARVAEHDRSVVTNAVTLVSTFQIRLIIPKNDPAGGRLQATLRIGPGASSHGSVEISCGS